jgi:hypothetical protein
MSEDRSYLPTGEWWWIASLLYLRSAGLAEHVSRRGNLPRIEWQQQFVPGGVQFSGILENIVTVQNM